MAIKALTGVGPLADVARFRREVRALVSLHHPAIVEVRDMGTHQGLPFLVLEYLSGGTLAARASRERIPDDEIRSLCADLLEGLAYAQGRGIVHRDVKPENVLLSEAGEAKLADFGLAQVAGTQKVTATGLVVGTPQFMAPEVLGGGEATGASDVYSLACVAWYLANRRPPHDGSPLEIHDARRRDPAPRGDEGPALRAFLQVAMRGDPADRPSPEALVALLREGTPVPARRPEAETADLRATTVVLAPSSSATSAAGGRGRVLAGVAGLAALVALGLASAPAPAPPPESVPSTSDSLAEAQARVDRWDRHVDGLDLSRLVPDLARLALGVEGAIGGEDLKRMQQLMNQGRVRRAGLPTRNPDLDAILTRLEARSRELPLKEELGAEREALAHVLADRAVPLGDRWELFEALDRLRRVDAFVEAWGLPPPYGLGEMLERVVPWGWEPAPEALQKGPLPPRLEGPPGAERRLLFHWKNSWDQSMPLLRGPVHPDYANGLIALGNMAILASTEGKWREQDHFGADARFEAEGPRPGEFLRLTFGTANLVAPLALRISLNGRRVRFFPPARFHGKDWWSFETLPKYLAHVDIPGELVVAGTNRVSFRPEYAPGLQCIHGFEFGWATLAWRPAQSTTR